jgi:leader peptidase (prepilin peptidase)/N-methyltransferase
MSDLAALAAGLTWWFIGATALLGLLIGSFLNVVVWRVPRGQSLLVDSSCPSCGTAITPWQNIPVLSWILLRGKCAQCGVRISARYPLVEIATAFGFGLVAWWYLAAFGWPPVEAAASISWWLSLSAHLWFAGITLALTLIDIDHQRLPNAIVMPSLVIVVTLLGAAALLNADWLRLVTTLGGAAALFVCYVLIALVYPKGIGGGDVKLAPIIGAMLGFAGWGAVIVGAFAGFVFGAVCGLALVALRRATLKSGVPFGPFMLAGAWLGIVIGTELLDSYLVAVGLA